MSARLEELEERVQRLADAAADMAVRQEQLERSTKSLRDGQRRTTQRIGSLEKTVSALGERLTDGLEDMGKQIDDQTHQINEHVDERHTAMQEFVLDNVVASARQWPASAIAGVSFVGAIVAGVLTVWLLSATGHIRVGAGHSQPGKPSAVYSSRR